MPSRRREEHQLTWRSCRRAVVAIGKPLGSVPRLGRLEPDLIGEFFALETLRGDPNNPFASRPHGWMPKTAWRTRGTAMHDFVRRSGQNFPQHPARQQIAITVPGVKESWSLAVSTVALAGATDIAQALENARALFLSPARSDLGAALALADLAVTVMDLEAGATDVQVLIAFLSAVAELHQAHANEPRLRERWAMSVSAFVHHRAAKDPEYCSHLLSVLGELHQAHADEPSLRELWARCVGNFTSDRAAEDPERCWGLLTDLAALHLAHAGEPALRKLWATVVTKFLIERAEEDPERC